MTTEKEPRMQRRQATLGEIAKRTGVHISTVSRVLRQPEPPDGWTDTARVIRAVAEEIGYRPNLMAASLRTRRTLTIGVVMSRLTDIVMASMYQSIESAATRANYQILLSSPPDTVEAQRRGAELLVDRQVDGLILASAHRPAEDFVTDVESRNVPVLLMNRHGDCFARPSITCDDRSGGYLAAKHLLDLGHRRIGVVAGPRHASTAKDRVEGVRLAMREHGLELAEELVANSDFEVEGGIEAGNRLLTMGHRPTAIFAVSDTAAIAVMGVARDLGLSLPQDLSVVGYNDIPLASQLPIPLTTVQSPFVEMGRLALDRMLDLLAGQQIESATLPVKLAVRESTRTWLEDRRS